MKQPMIHVAAALGVGAGLSIIFLPAVYAVCLLTSLVTIITAALLIHGLRPKPEATLATFLTQRQQRIQRDWLQDRKFGSTKPECVAAIHYGRMREVNELLGELKARWPQVNFPAPIEPVEAERSIEKLLHGSAKKPIEVQKKLAGGAR